MYFFKKDNISIQVLFSIAGLATQILVIDNKHVQDSKSKPTGLLIDIGDGTCRDLLSNGLDFSWINHVAITHGHYDHMGGLYTFLGVKRMLGENDPIHIYYPKDCLEVRNTIDLFETNYKDSNPFLLIMHPFDPISMDEKFKIEFSFEIQAYHLIHRSSKLKHGKLVTENLIPAIGFQINCISNNLTIAISGDTGPTPALYNLFKADIGFIEATHPNDNFVKDKVNRFHLTEGEAIKFSKYCKRPIIIHKLPRHIVKHN